jgi:aminopeptidase-like protein
MVAMVKCESVFRSLSTKVETENIIKNEKAICSWKWKEMKRLCKGHWMFIIDLLKTKGVLGYSELVHRKCSVWCVCVFSEGG